MAARIWVRRVIPGAILLAAVVVVAVLAGGGTRSPAVHGSGIGSAELLATASAETTDVGPLTSVSTGLSVSSSTPSTVSTSSLTPGVVATTQKMSPAQSKPTVPQIPTDVFAVAGNGAATVTWHAPAGSGVLPIKSYRVSAVPGNRSVTVSGSPAETTAIVTGLINGTSYSFSITATNSFGASPVAISSRVIPHDIKGRTPALFEPPNGLTYLGVSSSIHDLAKFNQTTRIAYHPAIFNSYTPSDGYFDQSLIDAAKFPGMTPMISWSVVMANNLITNGERDSYLAKEANVLRAYGKPVFLRLDWEMNGTWYPTYDVHGGVSPAEFILSWRHIHSFFAGIPNVAFVWSPNAGGPNPDNLTPFAWYPGDSQVDWIAADAYPDYLKIPTKAISGQYGLDFFAAAASAHGKPMMLAEWARGSTQDPADSGSTVNLVFDWAENYPNTVKALVYFDYAGPKEHDLETHPVGAAAFRARTVGNPKYLLGVFDSK